MVFMVLVPAPLDYAAFANAAQSILAPLSGPHHTPPYTTTHPQHIHFSTTPHSPPVPDPPPGFTLLLNIVLSPIFLKEKITRVDVAGTVLIAAGAGLTTSFGNP